MDSEIKVKKENRMEKVINFRDLGGIKTTDGRAVKAGVFFRSSSIDKASPRDREYLGGLGIKLIYDFRDNNWYEIRRKGDVNYLGVEYINEPVKVESANLIKLKRLSMKALRNLSDGDMTESYKKLLSDNGSFKRFFEVVKARKTPMLFNCSVGKDRTGVAAAVLLSMLGATREEVVRDYTLSRPAVPAIRENARKRMPVLFRKYAMAKMEPLFLAEPAFIEAVLDEIDRRGGVIRYFIDEYGYTEKDIADLRAEYTEPV